MGPRQEERVARVLSVRIWGMASSGKPFMQDARTVDISRTGAQLDGVDCLKEVGVVLGLQRGNVKARFRVVWVGQQDTPQQGRVGLCCLEPEKGIWGQALSEASSLEGISIGEGAISSTKADQRKSSRYHCEGEAELRPEGADVQLSVNLRDISLGGCYLEVQAPLPVNTRVRLGLRARGMRVQVKGLVRYSHPGAGMGVAFTEMSDADRKQLEMLLHQLRAGPEFESEILHTSPPTAPQEAKDTVKETSFPSNSEAGAALEFLLEVLLDKGVLSGEEFAKVREKLKAAKAWREPDS